MSDGATVAIVLSAGLLFAILVGWGLAWWVIGHNPLHRGRCPQ